MEIENIVDTTNAIVGCSHNHGTSYDYEKRVAICRACGESLALTPAGRGLQLGISSERHDYNVQLREWQRYL